MQKDIYIGIDLGTTYSCVAVYRNGSNEVIANDQGNRTTPSYVTFTESERLIGDASKNVCNQYIENTVFDSKRLIGKKFSDPEIQKDLKHWPFKVIAGPNDKPLICCKYMGEDKQFTAEEISAMILLKMKETAEAYLGCPVKNAVVTVPAYFNDSQRQATKDAGTIAGLNVVRIINEPTAAAIAYGLDRKSESDKEQNVLVYDLGGGTFDVSILSFDDKILEVKSTSGNTHLGGEDFDNLLVEHCAKEFYKKYKKDISGHSKAIRRLRTACEKAKRTLSSSTSANIEIDSLFEGIDFNMTLTRAKFEDLCKTEFDKCMPLVEKALKDAKLSKTQIHEIVLVGGSTRIPKVQDLLSSYFNGKQLCKSVNPDEAVAIGAAITAFMLSGGKDEKTGDLLLVDVCPLSLGVETAGNVNTVLIERNSRIPCKKTEKFSNSSDGQRYAVVKIFQGERTFTSDSGMTKLGEFEIEIPPGFKRGQCVIEITYELDANCILNVNAVETSTGKKKSVNVNSTKGNLSKNDISEMVKEAEKYKESDKAARDRVEAKNDLEGYVYNLKDTIGEETTKDKLGEDNFKVLVDNVTDTIKWLENNSKATTDEMINKKKELEKVCNPLLVKLYEMNNNSDQPGAPETNTSKPTVDEVD